MAKGKKRREPLDELASPPVEDGSNRSTEVDVVPSSGSELAARGKAAQEVGPKEHRGFLRFLGLRRVGLGGVVGSSEQAIGRSKVAGDVYQVSGVKGDIHIYQRDTAENPRESEAENLWYSRLIFRRSIQHRDQFVGSFLNQALRQANITFILSVIFMAVGGLLVLAAAVLALMHSAPSAPNGYITLATGLGGAVIAGSGAVFWRRADKSRKHLAEQAERMHSQLLEERKFVQVGEILAGVENPDLNDRARIALVLKLMDVDPASAVDARDTPAEAKDL
ncbi:hypothetical protein [Actinoplanes sp. NPDC026623]|uniref:TRADD-N-associated membrane domain-containing protein n=1 Tax=Actinoplanes sp. NPDC026623 TaxID=3155610 RepID=UPI0033E6C05F